MDFAWNSEQEMWRKAVRDFAQKEVTPRVREYDTSGEIPADLVQGMAQMGLLALTVPEAYGGMGADWTMACIAAEELGRADMSLALPVLYLVEASWGFIFAKYGSEQLKQELLPKVCAGDAFLGIATTEPGGGSDIVGATRCKAAQSEDGWTLNGEKMYISGVRESRQMGGVHLTLFRTGDTDDHKSFTFVAVPLKDTPGISPTIIEDMGRMGISTGGFAMEDVRVPAHHQVGGLNRGFYHAMEGFSAARTLIGATCTGAAEAALTMGMDWVKQRRAFGRPLASYEGIQFPLADLWGELSSTRLSVYKAAWEMDRFYQRGEGGHHHIAEAAAIVKLRAPLLAWNAMNEVANWFGAAAYSKEYPIEMGIRGVRSYSIGAEGTVNIQRLVIARELLGGEFMPYRN
jgi:alkylation response protein AidB-like acyl-CoA dehydrogenase